MGIKEILNKLGESAAFNARPAEEDEELGETIAELEIPKVGKLKTKREQMFDFGGEKVSIPIVDMELSEEDK